MSRGEAAGAAPAERRVHPRREVHLSVLCASGLERGEGTLVNVSLSGALVDPASIRPRLGAAVGLRFPTAGGGTVELAGTVVRHTPGGFALRFSQVNPGVRALVENGEVVL